MSQLPEAYTNVPPVVLHDKDPPVPESHSDAKEELNAVISATKDEFEWFETVMDLTERDESFLDEKCASWGAYHSAIYGHNSQNYPVTESWPVSCYCNGPTFVHNRQTDSVELAWEVRLR